jgi:hypothetical protein
MTAEPQSYKIFDAIATAMRPVIIAGAANEPPLLKLMADYFDPMLATTDEEEKKVLAKKAMDYVLVILAKKYDSLEEAGRQQAKEWLELTTNQPGSEFMLEMFEQCYKALANLFVADWGKQFAEIAVGWDSLATGTALFTI